MNKVQHSPPTRRAQEKAPGALALLWPSPGGGTHLPYGELEGGGPIMGRQVGRNAEVVDQPAAHLQVAVAPRPVLALGHSRG